VTAPIKDQPPPPTDGKASALADCRFVCVPGTVPALCARPLGHPGRHSVQWYDGGEDNEAEEASHRVAITDAMALRNLCDQLTPEGVRLVAALLRLGPPGRAVASTPRELVLVDQEAGDAPADASRGLPESTATRPRTGPRERACEAADHAFRAVAEFLDGGAMARARMAAAGKAGG
jgi:hypothetical protein